MMLLPRPTVLFFPPDLEMDRAERVRVHRASRKLIQQDFGPLWPLKRPAPANEDAARRRRLAGHNPVYLPLIPGLVALALPMAIIFLDLTRQPWYLLLIVLFLALQFPLTLWLMAWLGGRTMRVYIAEALRARGHDVCPNCHFIGAGRAEGGPCPECGEVLPPLPVSGAEAGAGCGSAPGAGAGPGRSPS